MQPTPVFPTHSPVTRRLWLALLAAVTLAAPSIAGAAAPSRAPVQARDAWIRWLPAGLPAGGYVTLHNPSNRPVDLVGASSPDYRQVMLHHSVMKGGTMQMLPVAKIAIPAGGDFSFKPGAYHLMLMQPTHSVKPGDEVPVTLEFAGGASLEVRFVVRKPDAGAGMGSMPMPMPGSRN